MRICADVQYVQRNINNINQGTYFFSTARRRVYILIINVIKEIKYMKKKSNKKGFTIMEMLIVVAIIAVLAAIAIPTFNGALTKSKEAADVANIRAAYAEAQVAILTDNKTVAEAKDVMNKSLGATAAGNTTTYSKLNYSDKFAYVGDAAQYSPKKLNDGKQYKWELKLDTYTDTTTTP